MTKDDWSLIQRLEMTTSSHIKEAADRITDLEVLRLLRQLPTERFFAEELKYVFPGVTDSVAYVIAVRMYNSQPRLIDICHPWDDEFMQQFIPPAPEFTITDAGRHIVMSFDAGLRANQILRKGRKRNGKASMNTRSSRPTYYSRASWKRRRI